MTSIKSPLAWYHLTGPLAVATASAMVFLAACTTVEAPVTDTTPFPFTIQVITPTPPSQAPECPVALCCFLCPTFPGHLHGDC